MELVDELVLLLHLVGFAALFGGILIQVRATEPEVNAAMVHGSYTMLVTGLALAVFAKVGVGSANEFHAAKLVTKLIIAAIITFLVIINRRFTSIPKGLWGLLGLLTLGNAVLAVLWQ